VEIKDALKIKESKKAKKADVDFEEVLLNAPLLPTPCRYQH
jgi:hypothetical protein